jgi:hypothetical protein
MLFHTVNDEPHFKTAFNLFIQVLEAPSFT